MKRRKLRLHKETIRNLADGHLAAVAGGVPLTRARSVMDCEGTLTEQITGCEPTYSDATCNSGHTASCTYPVTDNPNCG